MKNLLISALVAAVVSLATIAVYDRQEMAVDRPAPVASSGGDSGSVSAGVEQSALSYTDALVEDTWVNAGRTAGSDRRALTDSASSICYLTKIEISGIQGPDDSNACAIEVDDFTGFWQLIATVDEGGRSEVRCNARCLIWDSE